MRARFGRNFFALVAKLTKIVWVWERNNPENGRENDYPPMCNSPLRIGGLFFARTSALLHVGGRILAARIDVIINHALQRTLRAQNVLDGIANSAFAAFVRGDVV